MRPFYVSHLELFKATDDGVTLNVPLNTRQLHLVPSLAAVPVEVFPGGKATAGKIQDGRFLHEPGAVLYPGGTLLLREGVSQFAIRALPGMNAGFQRDRSAADPRAEIDNSTTHWVGEGGGSDAVLLGTAVARLAFLTDDVTIQGGGMGNADGLPASLTVAALEDPTTSRPSRTAQGQCNLYAPHEVIPAEIMRKFTRVRLRVRVGQAFTLAATALQEVAMLTLVSPLDVVQRLQYLGAYCAAGAVLPQDAGNGASDVVIDFGTPAECFPALQEVATNFGAIYISNTPTHSPCIFAEWILDRGTSERGAQSSTCRFRDDVDLNTHRCVYLPVRKSGEVRVMQVSGAPVGAELRLWRRDRDVLNGGDTTDAPDVTVPLPSSPGSVVAVQDLGPGQWQCAIFGGTSGTKGNFRMAGREL